MSELSTAPVRRLLVEASGGMRVGGSAVDLALAAAEKYLRQLGFAARQCASADRRKTIQDSDIARAISVVN